MNDIFVRTQIRCKSPLKRKIENFQLDARKASGRKVKRLVIKRQIRESFERVELNGGT